MDQSTKLPREMLGNLSTKSSNQLYAFAMSLTKDQFEAEDLYQDTLFLAIKNSNKFRVGTNFMAWMKTIMRNSFINGYRRKKRFMNYVNDKVTAYFNEGPQIRNEAESKIMMDELSEIIEDIDERFKTPFKLFYKGYSYEEIANDLELPLGTVKSRIFIARRKIRSGYNRFYGIKEDQKV